MVESALREWLFRGAALIGAGLVCGYHVPAQVPSPVSRLQLTVSVASDTLVLGRPSRIMIRAQVTDPQGRPVRRAIVVFVILPSASGASALFATGGRSDTLATDDQGIAQAVIERPTGGRGEYQVEVKASYEGLTAESKLITLKNVQPPTPVSKWIAIGAVAGGGGALGALLATRGGNKPGTPPAAQPTRIIQEGPGVVR